MTDVTSELDRLLEDIQAAQSAADQRFNDFTTDYREFVTTNHNAMDSLSNSVTTRLRELSAELAVLTTTLTGLAFRLTAVEAIVRPRDSYAIGERLPDGSNTGAPQMPTTRISGFTSSYDGQIVEDTYIDGQVTINHYVELRRCHLKGGTPTAPGYAVVRCYKPLSKRAKLIDCTIESVPHKWSAFGVQGRDIEIIRCNIFGSVDTVMATNSGLRMVMSYLHDLFWSATGHTDGGPTHNDLLQIEGGGNHEVLGNNFQCGPKGNAAIMVTQNAAPITGLLIESNWLTSTEPDPAKQTPVAINLTQSGKGPMTGVRIAKNKASNAASWGRDRIGWIDSGTYDAMVAKGDLVGNTYDDGTEAVFGRNKVTA